MQSQAYPDSIKIAYFNMLANTNITHLSHGLSGKYENTAEGNGWCVLPEPQMIYTLFFKPEKAILSRAIGCFSGPCSL
jgi:hypothetical protein